MLNKKIHNIFLISATFLMMLFFIFGLINPAKAATFNPNNLITDSAFTNKNSMSPAEIENYFRVKGSYFYNYTVPEYVSVPYPYRDGSGNPAWGSVNVRQINAGNGQTATLYSKKLSQLIWDESQAHNINPQVIIVLMQRESSSITQNNISNTRKAWPIFYGFNETMASFQYDQATSRARAVSYGGAGQQIARATLWLKLYYDDANLNPFSIDGQTITPLSKATRILYIYTPHIYNGNYNFWNYMNAWFAGGLPLSSSPANYHFAPIPETSLKKYQIGEVWKYYLIYNEKRYFLGSVGSNTSNYGYPARTAVVMTQEQYASYEDGAGMGIEHYVRNSAGDNYLVVGGLKYKVYPTDCFKQRWGFDKLSPATLPLELLNAIPDAPTTYLTGYARGHIYLSRYYIDLGGQKYKIYNNSVFRARWGFKTSDMIVLPEYFLKQMNSRGYLSGLVKNVSNSQVYYIDLGKKYPIYKTSSFWNRWGFNKSDVVTISNMQLKSIPTTKWLTGLVKAINNGQLYYINNHGKKYKVAPGLTTWYKYHFSIDDISKISASQLGYMRYAGTIR